MVHTQQVSVAAPVQQATLAPNVSNPILETGAVRQSRTAKRPLPYTRRQKQTTTASRSSHFSNEEICVLLDVVEAHRPIGSLGWAVVTDAHNRECQLRGINNL